MISRFSSKKYVLLWVAVVALLALAVVPVSAEGGFTQGIVVELDGELYRWKAPGTLTDIPGHYWIQAGPDRLVGKHYNSGPFPQFWSSDAPDGELLYMATVIIDEWTPEKAELYASKGYVHYHEFVRVSDGKTHHPTKVGWFKHIARTSFTLDRGPRPDLGHKVTPGIDFEFMPNYSGEYIP